MSENSGGSYDVKGLNLFRSFPVEAQGDGPLLSSFQAFETSLYLLALRRYPAALISCVNAWESAIKAFHKMSPDDKTDLYVLLDDIFNKHKIPRRYRESVTKVRLKRNVLVHYGASPSDDQESLGLILKTGFPFYIYLIRYFFDLYLDWKEFAPNAKDFYELKDHPGSEKCVLIPAYGEALVEAVGLYAEFGVNPLIRDKEFCCAKIAYLICNDIKTKIFTAQEAFSDVWNEEWAKFRDSRGRLMLEYFDEWAWVFDCPICRSGDSFYGEIDQHRSKKKSIRLNRGVCIECGFQIQEGNKGVLDKILQPQLGDAMPKILKSFSFYL